jgi:hypothetical protein
MMKSGSEKAMLGEIGGRAVRLTAVLLIAFAAAFFFYYGLDTINDPVFGIDFLPYHVAGKLAAAGDWEPLTDYASTGGFEADSGPFLEAFHRYFFPDSPEGLRWIYFPAYVWIFRPLAGLPFPAAARVWLLVNAVLIVLSIGMLIRARPGSGGQSAVFPRTALFIFLGLTFQPVLDNLWHGNVSVLIFSCFCLSYYLLKKKRNLLSGLVLGLIVPLKFYPAIFLPYFIWRRNWRLVAGAVLSCLLLFALSLFTVGWERNLAYFEMVRGELGSGGIAAFNNQSINGFLLHIFPYGDVNVWENTPTPFWLTALRLILALVVILAVLRVIRRRPEETVDPAAAQDLDLTLVIFVMLLASPITWYHYYTWLLLPLYCLFDGVLRSRDEGRGIYILLAVGYGLTAVQGIDVIRPFAAAALDRVRLLRALLSQSFFGAVLLLLLALRLRREVRPRKPPGVRGDG